MEQLQSKPSFSELIEDKSLRLYVALSMVYYYAKRPLCSVAVEMMGETLLVK